MESLFETDSELKDRGRSKSGTCDLFWKAGPGVFDEDYLPVKHWQIQGN